MSDNIPDTTGLREAVEALAWIIHRASGCGLYPTPVGISDDVCPPDREDFDAARAILASDWLANHVTAAREADRAEVAHRSDMVLHQQRRAEAAEERLAGLVAKIEALRLDLNADADYRVTKGSIGHRLRALIPADAATALDAVREKAKAEERERIAQAIEALTEPEHVTGYREAVEDAARIARREDQ